MTLGREFGNSIKVREEAENLKLLCRFSAKLAGGVDL